jgi:hypothetical protein
MTIYIDEPRFYQKSPLGPRKWCHMATDGDVEELHSMAKSLGLKRSWFQDGRMPHYDLVESKRVLAIKKGAIEVTGIELARKCWLSLMEKGNG